MPYSPTVNDNSGQILGASFAGMGQSLGQGIEKMQERQKQIDIDAKAMQSLAKSHPELVGNIDVQSMSPVQLAQTFRGMTKATEVGMNVQRGNYYGGRAEGYQQLGQRRATQDVMEELQAGLYGDPNSPQAIAEARKQLGLGSQQGQPTTLGAAASAPRGIGIYGENNNLGNRMVANQQATAPFAALAQYANSMNPVQKVSFAKDVDQYKDLATQLQGAMPTYDTPNMYQSAVGMKTATQTNSKYTPGKIGDIVGQMATLQAKHGGLIPQAIQLGVTANPQPRSNPPAQTGAFGTPVVGANAAVQ